MKTFHSTRNTKKSSWVSFLLMLALTVFMAYLPFGMFEILKSISSAFGEADTLSPLPLLACSLPFLLFLLMTVWMGIYLAAARKACLRFEEKTLVFESINRFKFLLYGGRKPFVLPYDQIKIVKFNGFAGKIEMVDYMGKKYFIFPLSFAKKHGEEVLIELHNHLPPETFAAGMEISDILKRWSKLSKIRTVFTISFVVVYLATLFFDPMFSSHSWLTSAWKVELRPLGYESVWTYSTDSQDGFWILSWKSDYYRVYRYSDKLENEWKLPETLPGKDYPQSVSGDKNGIPIIWMESHVLHYENDSWKAIPYDDSLDVRDWEYNGLVSGEWGWAIDVKKGQDNRLLKINALTGKWSVVPLPETALRQKLSPRSIQRAVNGDFLVLMQSDTDNRVYVLSDDEWTPKEYPVILLENSRVWNYFLDGNTSLWVLLETQNKFVVEKVDLNDDLQVTQLPSPKETDEWKRYDCLMVDSAGRLWINGSYPEFMAVFTPVWQGEAKEIERYTEKNSNYQGGISTRPVMLPDGQIWSFGRNITTMDTNQTTLSSPLPAWYVSWDWNLIRLFIILLSFVLLFIANIYSRSYIVSKK